MTEPADRDLPDERMDHRLQTYGAHWRAGLPEPASPGSRSTAGSGRRWLVPAAAAAAVVLVTGVTFAITRNDDLPAPAGPVGQTSTGNATGVVPWAPLPPTHPDLRPPVVSFEPPPVPSGTPGCTADAVTAGRRTVEGAAGTLYLSLRLDLAPGAEPCVIDDWPRVTLLDHGTIVDAPIENVEWQGRLGDGVFVTADNSAVITLAWAVSHHCGDVGNDAIRLTLPAGGNVELAGFGETSCNPGEGSQTVHVLAPRPTTDYGPHRQRSPWQDVEATGDLDLSARSNGTVEFEVTLTAATDLALDNCPDYTVVAGAESTYGLNCAAVPYRNGDDDPYLPAGIPVTFAMRVEAVRASTRKFLWVLDAPGNPGVDGTITIRGDRPAETGTVSGIVTMDGGPAPGSSVKVTSGAVRFVDGDEEYDAEIGPDGSYQIELPAGSYDVLVASDQWSSSQAYADGPFGVTGGAVNPLDIAIPVE